MPTVEDFMPILEHIIFAKTSCTFLVRNAWTHSLDECLRFKIT